MAAKRILLVDDQREVTRMLRASLETLGRDYTIVDVPSGEEAILEVKRGGVDLLVTDVRLPGMSGLEVIQRLRKANNQAKIIVISGYPAPETEAEAKKLGAIFFNKPVALSAFLPAVQEALGMEAEAPASAAPTAEAQPGIADRISTLRRDLGALAVFLVDLDGKVVVRAGDVTRLDTDAVLTPLMASFSASMHVCKLLGGVIPANVQYFDGDDFDIYSANVGSYFALVIIFDGQRGSSQMGPVMRYGRQCADDLLNSLVLLGVTPASTPAAVAAAPAEVVQQTVPAAAPAQAAKPGSAPEPPPAKPAEPEPPAKPLSADELKALDDAVQKVSQQAATDFWDTALTETEDTATRSDALTWEQAEKLGLAPKK